MKKLIILIMLTISPIFAQCDWNEDGTLNVIDVVETVDCILNDCFSEDIYGCTDPDAINYNPDANIDDESCEYDIPPIEDYFSYNQSSSQAFYYFEIATIDGVGLEEGDWIGAFNGDICVGSSAWWGPFTDVPVMGDDGTIGTSGYLFDGDIPGFIIYDASSNSYLNATSFPEVQWTNLQNIFIDELVASSNQNDVLGCTDSLACNYDENATFDIGCMYDDCEGTCGGDAIADDCNVCNGSNADMDCSGICFGSAYEDECGLCDDDPTNDSFYISFGDFGGGYDCAGVCFGDSYFDDCGVCDDDNWNDDFELDCFGICFGEAFANECGCVGGTTGLEVDFCYGCTDPDAINYNHDATIDDGSCDYPELITDMVLIPAGEYTAGEWDAIISIDYDYEIMKYEVTVEQYYNYLIEALETGEVWHVGGESGWIMGYYEGQEYQFFNLETSGQYGYGTIFWNGWYFDINLDGFWNHPIVQITWYGANAFAEYYGMRLPTTNELEKSARGMTGNNFPWGNNNLSCELCNYYTCVGSTAEVGSYNASIPYGLFDLSGNVEEWTSTFHSDSEMYLKGGAWGLNTYSYFLTWGNSRYLLKSESDVYSGFRLVRDID